jgi:hypothetical protein
MDIFGIQLILLVKIMFGVFGAILGLYTLRYIKDIALWIKGGVENGDNKLENNELQIFIFTALLIFMVMAQTFFSVSYDIELYLIVASGAGVLYGLNQLKKIKTDGNK